MALLNTSIFTPSTLSVYSVNTAVPSTLLTLPPVSTQQGSFIIIKDRAGNAFTNRIILSTTGIDGISTSILSTNYGTWFLVNDGIKSWFILDSYTNSVSTGTKTVLTPFAPLSVNVSIVGTTLSATWTPSPNAVSYSISFFTNTSSANTGGTLIQTITSTTNLYATLLNVTITQGAQILFFYASVTAVNANGTNITSSSPAIQPILLPSTPSGLSLSLGASALTLTCSVVPFATSYTASFYQGNSLFQTINTGLVTITTTNGTKFSDATYNYYTFTSGTGNFIITGSLTVDILVVAGGGGGGSQHGGGGGGAGQVLYFSSVTLAASNYSVSVGAGGASNPSVSPYNGSNGSPSVFGIYTAIGGGGGGGETGIPPTGGFNGGGAAGGPNGINGAAAGSDSYGNTGFRGGNNGQTTGTYGSGGGGGGAIAAGADATGTGNNATTPGNGGSGTSAFSSWGLATTTGQNISGTVWYGGGGGGGYWGNARGGGSGGNGGGGAGGNDASVGTGGTANTGGGGGGSPGSGTRNGGVGGSGIVIVRTLLSAGLIPSATTTNTLVAGASYYATIQAVNAYGASATAISNSVTSSVIPLPTTSVIIYLNGFNLLCIWNTATNATRYTVQFYQNASPTTSGGSLFETATSTAIQQSSSITLVNGNYYYATVTSVNSYGSSTAVTSSGTSAITALPASESPYVEIVLSGTNLLCTWTAARNAVTYTIIFYQNRFQTLTGGTLFQTITGQASTSQASSILLVNGNFYYATVQSINSFGQSAIVTSAKTSAAAANPPQPPTALTIIVSGINLLCSWTAGLNATSYTVVFYQNNTDSTIGGTLFETATSRTTSQPSSIVLVNTRFYYATVTSVNAFGSSSTITTTGTSGQITNPPPGAVSAVSISVSGVNLLASWNAGINATSYTVTFFRVASQITSSGTIFQTITGQTGISQTSSTLLINGFYYYCTVASVNPYGTATAVTSATATPIIGNPPQPPSGDSLSFALVGGTTNTLTVNWTGGLNATSYRVDYYENLTAIITGGTLIRTNNSVLATTDTNSVGVRGGYYYYATVTSFNGFGSSSGITTVTAIQATVAASPVTNLTITLNGVYATTSWTASINTVSYTVRYFRVATSTTTGGTLFETNTLVIATTNTSINILLNESYYYATVTSINAFANSSPVTSSSATVLVQVAPLSSTNVSVTFSGTQVTATWNSSVNATSYTILFYLNATATTSGGTLFQTFTGNVGLTQLTSNTLLNGYYYYATVQSINTYGSSPIRTSASTTPLITTILPTAPSNVAVSFAGTQVTATWTASAFNATSYTITYFQVGSSQTTGGILFETVTGNTGTTQLTSIVLVNGFFYYATVAGINVNGSSSVITSATATVQITTILPTPPINPTIVFSPNFMTASWTASVKNATSYTVEFYENATATTTGGTLFQTNTAIVGTSQVSQTYLVYNQYYYAIIYGINTNGSSAGIKTSTAVIAAFAPLAPTNVTVSFSGTQVTASWTASSFTSTYTIIFYEVASATTTGGTVFETVTGTAGTTQLTSLVLVNNQYYYATVRSVNPYSTSAAIISSSSTTQVTGILPTNPTNVSISLSGDKASVSWTASTKNAVSYTVIIYNPATNVTTGGTTFQTTNGITGTTLLSTNSLTSGQYYYATVTAINIFGSSSTITSSSALLASILPTGGAITLNSGLLVTDGTVTISSATLATQYTVYISTTTSAANSVYSFTTTTTGLAVAFTASPLLIANTTYYAILLPNNIYGNGTFSSSAGVATPAPLYSFSGTLNFTSAGATGSFGPTLSQCRTAYSSFGSWINNSNYFNMTLQGNQIWTVPETRNYIITCAGAGNINYVYYNNTIPAGAVITTTVFLTQGHKLSILCGQYGTKTLHGSGGSLVYNITTSTVLIVSGGSGGDNPNVGFNPSGTGLNASLTNSGPTNGATGPSASGLNPSRRTGSDAGCLTGGNVQTYSYNGTFNGGNGGIALTQPIASSPGGFGGGNLGGSRRTFLRETYWTYTCQPTPCACRNFTYNDPDNNITISDGGCGLGGCAGSGGGGGYSGGAGSAGSGSSANNPQGIPGVGGGSFCSTTITSSSISNGGQGYISIT